MDGREAVAPEADGAAKGAVVWCWGGSAIEVDEVEPGLRARRVEPRVASEGCGLCPADAPRGREANGDRACNGTRGDGAAVPPVLLEEDAAGCVTASKRLPVDLVCVAGGCADRSGADVAVAGPEAGVSGTGDSLPDRERCGVGACSTGIALLLP